MDKEIYDRKLNLKLSEFSGHFMNDTKWRKLFHLFSTEGLGVVKVKIISVWKDGDSSSDELDINQLKNFENTFNKSGINDVLIGGPLYFKEIKKIVVQTNAVKILSLAIDKLGMFEKDEKLNEIIILGYK